MRANILQFFKDRNEVWHQPGNIDDINDSEIDELTKRGAIKVIETMAVSQPETRIQGGKDEAHHRNHKRKFKHQ
jgi:acetylglutamate kinase